MKKTASASDPLWYKDAIIYELHVRAFADSNGDGIGDFPGLLSRLDYLEDLGITCIWLLPFFPSPLRDDGYDISNYVDVNPSYGTLDDFKAFLDAAHRRNIQVMIELVINHTSNQHPWFKAARTAPPGSPQREMYVWSETDQLFKDARIIFTDTEKSNWTWDEVAGAFYWHRFFSHQPDLNFDNPLVLEEVLKTMRFWLDMGVDALRMDAIPYLVERDSTSCENLAETHVIIKAIRAAIDSEYANRLILAEANQWPSDVRPYFGDGDECHMAFHFPLMPRIYMALRQEDRLPITDIMAQTPPIPDNCQWALFLRNHDELTLEMVTADERDYMYFAYSADPRMRINVGIRRRLAPLVDNNRRRIELLNSLLLSFPGTPVLYYGDELGMGDNIYLGDRNGVRTPMQWTSDRNAGFSKCDPARLYFPVVMDPIYGYQVINVEAQLSDQSSLLHWTRNMIALRKLFQVFGRGALTFLNPSNRKILAYLREFERSDGSHEIVLCVANLSRFAQAVSLDLSAYAGREPVEMLGYVQFPAITASPYSLSLASYSFLWLELQPSTAEAPLSPAPAVDLVAENDHREDLEVDLVASGWKGLLSGRGLDLLRNALVAWMPRQRWFGAKARRVQSVRVLYWAELPNDGYAPGSGSNGSVATHLPPVRPAQFFVEVTYNEGHADIYQVPLAISMEADLEAAIRDRPESILARINTKAGWTVLHDAVLREDFRRNLFALIGGNKTLSLHANQSPEAATDIVSLADLPLVESPPRLTDRADVTNYLETSSPTGGPHLSNDTRAHTTEHAAVTPAPLDAQPGELATGPRSSAPAHSGESASLQPRESPSAGNPAPRSGRLDARASSALSNSHFSQRLVSKVISGEQSNTSIIYGRQFILKLFRYLQTGENPDVEVGRYLTEVGHFSRIPQFLGEISITPAHEEKITVAMLQGFVENDGDGWEWFLRQLGGFYTSVSTLPAPSASSAIGWPEHSESDSTHPTSANVLLDAAKLLGVLTAEMHLILGKSTDLAAFSAEPYAAEDLEQDTRRILEQLGSTMEAVKARFPTFDDATSDAAGLFLSIRLELIERIRAISSLPLSGQRIRIHGDFHLGQVLHTEGAASGTYAQSAKDHGDFVLLDFEGEPARPLSERRKKQSPLRDVAGMLRSFSYVAHSALERFSQSGAGASDSSSFANLSALAVQWEEWASTAFLSAYRDTIEVNSKLLPSSQLRQALLQVYMLEKALYELLYELNNRPAWVRIPIEGILRMSHRSYQSEAKSEV